MSKLENLHSKASFKTMKEVTKSLIHSTIEFCAEIYLRQEKNQKLVQKKLNSVMRMLLEKDMDASVSVMLHDLRWLNVTNMWRWCCIRTLNRMIHCPRQAPFVWGIIKHNMEIGIFHYEMRYKSLKLAWRRLTRWARESFVFCAVDVYNTLGLHGRAFADYKEMRDQIRSTLIRTFGNANVT